MDYHKLDTATILEPYPMLAMDECIDFLVDATIFSTLDPKTATGKWRTPMWVAKNPLLRFITVYSVKLEWHST